MARSTSSPVAASGTADHAVPGRSLALHVLLSLRPAQWTKNLLVFAGLLFGRRLFDPISVVDAVSAFAVFCALSGAVYLVNDIADRESDRLHPLKSQRPIASGTLPVPVALGAALALGSGALGSACTAATACASGECSPAGCGSTAPRAWPGAEPRSSPGLPTSAPG